MAYWRTPGGDITYCISVLAILFIGPIPVAAQTEQRRITYGAETDFVSGYVWHGILESDKPAMEAEAWISGSGFTFTAWSSLDLANRSESANLTYRRDWGKLRLEPSVEAYLNHPPAGVHDPASMEAALKLSYPAGPFRVFAIHAFDVMAHRGAYYGEAGLAYESRIKKNTVLAASLYAGWASSKFNDVYIGLRKPAFNFVGAEGSLTYYVSRSLYFQPHFELSKIADRRLREYLPRPSVFNFGLAMGVEF